MSMLLLKALTSAFPIGCKYVIGEKKEETSIPDELIVEIFSNLSNMKDLMALRGVSRGCKKLVENRLLWQKTLAPRFGIEEVIDYESSIEKTKELVQYVNYQKEYKEEEPKESKSILSRIYNVFQLFSQKKPQTSNPLFEIKKIKEIDDKIKAEDILKIWTKIGSYLYLRVDFDKIEKGYSCRYNSTI